MEYLVVEDLFLADSVGQHELVHPVELAIGCLPLDELEQIFVMGKPGRVLILLLDEPGHVALDDFDLDLVPPGLVLRRMAFLSFGLLEGP